MLLGSLSLAGLIAITIALLTAIDVHEFSHAWMAYRLGDPTAKNMGRLTLNPLAHLDLLGTLMLLVAGFGWGKPVPFNPYNLRNGPQAGMAMVSFAGPLANLFTASLFALPLRLGWIANSPGGRFIPSPGDVLEIVILINIVLAVFNLLPIAPLDGFKVAVGLLPSRWAYPLSRLEYYGPLILILLVMSGRLTGVDVLGSVLHPAIDAIRTLLLGS